MEFSATVGVLATMEVLATMGDLVILPPQLRRSCPRPFCSSQPPWPLWTPRFPLCWPFGVWSPLIVVTILVSLTPAIMAHPGYPAPSQTRGHPGPLSLSLSLLTVMGTEFLLAGMLRTSLAVPSRCVETRPWKLSALTGMRGAGELSGLVT